MLTILCILQPTLYKNIVSSDVPVNDADKQNVLVVNVTSYKNPTDTSRPNQSQHEYNTATLRSDQLHHECSVELSVKLRRSVIVLLYPRLSRILVNKLLIQQTQVRSADESIGTIICIVNISSLLIVIARVHCIPLFLVST